MRILGLTPCFFPVCEGLGGGWDFQGVTVVVVVVVGLGGGDPITITITITIAIALESKGGDPRMGVLEYGVGWGWGF